MQTVELGYVFRECQLTPLLESHPFHLCKASLPSGVALMECSDGIPKFSYILSLMLQDDVFLSNNQIEIDSSDASLIPPIPPVQCIPLVLMQRCPLCSSDRGLG